MGKTLIIKGADFSKVAIGKIPTPASAVNLEIQNSELILGASTFYLDRADKTLTNNISIAPNIKSRATILVPESYKIETAPLYTNDFLGTYSHICIPTSEITNIVLNMTNSDYYYGLAIWWNLEDPAYDSGWTQGGNTLSFNISEYFSSKGMEVPEKIWLASSVKIGSSGTDKFTNETKESLGWSCEIN